MLVNTARVIHIGLNYVIAPKRPLTVDEKLAFQKELSMIGLEAEKTAKKEGGVGIKASYEGTTVIVETFMNSPNTGQLLILMPENPNSVLFSKIAEAVGEIYIRIFTDPKPQVFAQKDGSIRKLYSCSPEYPHAFQYIWEKMLGKSPEELSVLGKPILGGGLRFVMPPTPNEPIETQVKIESFIQDPKLLWVEATMKWLQPEEVGTNFPAGELYARLNDFIDKNVAKLMSAQ
ncbi:hypothetical protein HZA56_22420 [Candidatus Poribacteria bacterium]|nr:hypothetical protein [Candidatus Poribacteria bacterium]